MWSASAGKLLKWTFKKWSEIYRFWQMMNMKVAVAALHFQDSGGYACLPLFIDFIICHKSCFAHFRTSATTTTTTTKITNNWGTPTYKYLYIKSTYTGLLSHNSCILKICTAWLLPAKVAYDCICLFLCVTTFTCYLALIVTSCCNHSASLQTIYVHN